ncbi:HlyD family efflux transporter periplasmic adaptor subunit [Pedobacter sp. LMG 31464]|uniref:HlyD family efflux transporter periplasmic adaptor subunit n=1 Tax=Pedobacter planticolens TaxID=2679964 RepID=A0A923DYH1_9SPHI|nr:HlyD family efflux transporter periplasmic adaptor subunit [Pedobacter planticolens]MBB2146376.1 HlyD family efflux transporter periplasmic adaptor subunit [Pedobacter planticolens]
MIANLQNTSLVYLHQTRKSSQLIYVLTLMAVIVAITSLPFLYTTVNVKGKGLMQSSVEKTELFAPANGRLVSVNLTDNQRVKRGTTLLVMDASLSKQQNVLLNSHANQLQQQLHDAEQLTKMNNLLPSTSLYQASLQQYQEQMQNASNATKQAERILERYKILYNKKVVTLAEFEQYKFNYEQALSDEQMVSKKYKSQWQTEANQYRNELRDLKNQTAELNEQAKQYILKAIITGSLQNLTGVQAGAYVYANQKLGEISPDSALMAYCFIKPADIGLIKIGQEVRFQIDAFNYNQWGILMGKVTDIADDIIIKDQTPYFKVKCQLNKSYLQLKNGYKGNIKKGMTFSANFTVTRRSFYQLLYDKVDDWLNPVKG